MERFSLGLYGIRNSTVGLNPEHCVTDKVMVCYSNLQLTQPIHMLHSDTMVFRYPSMPTSADFTQDPSHKLAISVDAES